MVAANQVCPACRRPFPPRLVVSGPMRQRVVDIVSSRPDGITASDIMNLVYASDPDGGPQSTKVIHVLVFNANRQLRPKGYAIAVGWKGRGARYHLMKWGRKSEA